MPEDWSAVEVGITVEAYFDMLADELKGIPYNKTAVRAQVLPKLENRSNGSLEFKNCNISAALLNLGFPSIDGYKPRWNYQRDLLHAAIGEALANRPDVVETAESVVQSTPEYQCPLDILSIFDDEPPESEASYSRVAEGPLSIVPGKRNFLEIEARNQAIGLAGERLVIAYEKARLIRLGKDSFADRIEHVSVEKGDGEGFDVRSFDDQGDDLFIEVKTTRFRKESPFHISANEVAFSKANARKYALYRVYRLTKDPRFFALSGNIEKNCHLSAVNFRGSFS